MFLLYTNGLNTWLKGWNCQLTLSKRDLSMFCLKGITWYIKTQCIKYKINFRNVKDLSELTLSCKNNKILAKQLNSFRTLLINATERVGNLLPKETMEPQ